MKVAEVELFTDMVRDVFKTRDLVDQTTVLKLADKIYVIAKLAGVRETATTCGLLPLSDRHRGIAIRAVDMFRSSGGGSPISNPDAWISHDDRDEARKLMELIDCVMMPRVPK